MSALSVLIRCNAGHLYGYGHINRCLALAQAFVTLGCSVTFVLNSPEAVPLVREKKHVAVALDASDEDTALAALVDTAKPDILLLDVRPPHSLSILREIKKKVHLTAVLDDLSEQRLFADVLYLPPVPAVDRADWTDFTGQKRVGLQWMPTGINFTPPPYRKPTPPYRLLMTMGGSDPWGYTARLAPVFSAVCREAGILFGVVVGPGFTERERQLADLGRLPGPPLLFDVPSNMGEVYGWCDAAVVPMCVSAYELAYSAKPALYICPNDDYREHAKVFEQASLGKVLIVPNNDEYRHYKIAVEDLINFIDTNRYTHNSLTYLSLRNPAQAIAADIISEFNCRTERETCL